MRTIIFLLLFAGTAFAQCGSPKSRQSVKDATDGITLSLTPVTSSIKEQCELLEPTGKWESMPRQDNEKILYRISGMLTWAGIESDGDYHLVVSDGRRTMIWEIPDPNCVASDHRYAPLWRTARHTVDSLLGKPLTKGVKKVTPIPVTGTGYGFFDEPKHNGTGHAPNERELHALCWITKSFNK